MMLKGNGAGDFDKAKDLESIDETPIVNGKLASDESNQLDLICTQQHAADVDGDGDLDLVVGSFGNNFFLFENKAESENGDNRLVAEPEELSVKSPEHHSAPHLCDWDNDGDLDLLTGASGGGVLLAENIGTPEKPEWKSFAPIVPKPVDSSPQFSDDEHFAMAGSTRVWARDLNGDGWLDLLVGDSSPVMDVKDGVSKATLKTKLSKLAEKTAALEELSKGMGADGSNEDFKRINEAYEDIQEFTDSFAESRQTGYVWMLIRKPPSGSPNKPL